MKQYKKNIVISQNNHKTKQNKQFVPSGVVTNGDIV